MRTKRSMIAALLFGAIGLASAPLAYAAAGDPECPPHSHLVVEKDEDEGGTMKRCICDEGWDEGGPAPPCKQKGGKAPAKDGGKGGKADKADKKK